MATRLKRLALAPLLLSMLLVPTHADAQGGEIAFPPVGSGRWEGVVRVSGYISSDMVRGDGSFDTTVTDIIDDTAITLEFVVGDDGQATSGTMTVDLTWFTEGVGTSPTTFDPYRVLSDQHQTGTLAITGDASQLVAAGTLTHESNVFAEGGLVEAVSGTEIREVQWAFQVLEANCVLVTGAPIWTSGVGVMNYSRHPLGTFEDAPYTYSNQLAVHLMAWPADVFEDPDEIKEALEEIALAADGIRLREYPEASHLLELVQAWNDLKAELAGLDECQTTIVGWVPQSEKSWLVDLVRLGVTKALENPDDYKASDLIDFWIVGLSQGALDSGLFIEFIDAFFDKLDEAIANGDTDTMYDILSFATAYYISPRLYSEAKAALEGASE